MKVTEDVHFAYRTTQDILKRLLEDDFVMRCDKDALDDGRIEPVPEDKSGRRTYYYITEKGVERIKRE